MTLKAYIELIRLPNAILSGIGAVFSVLVYHEYAADYSLLVAGFLTGFLLTGASMTVNDLVDLEVDRVNKPWKPLPRGDAAVGLSLVLAVLMVTVVIAVNALIGVRALVVSTAYCVVGISYSFLRRCWWSHALVALSTTGPVVYGYVVAGLPPRDLYFTVLFSTVIVLVNLGREILKAVQDVEGDLKHGYRTVATVFGIEKASRAMLITGLAGSLLGIYTVTTSTGPAYKALMALATALYAHSVVKAYRNALNKVVSEKSRKRTLVAMFIGMAAFWLSKLD